MIETIRQGLKEDGLAISVSKLCRWTGVPRRTVYYRIREGRLHTVRTLGGSQRVLVASLEALKAVN